MMNKEIRIDTSTARVYRLAGICPKSESRHEEVLLPCSDWYQHGCLLIVNGSLFGHVKYKYSALL